ncbi:MAG: MarR family winged helix-turn-helix transcriptional regulator [Pseudorhodoplanes sp.]
MAAYRERDGAAAQIAELVDRLARLVRAQGHGGALNPAQWDALRYLARCNRFSNTAGALARYLGATKGTVSQTLNALERKHLIEREPDRSSGRVIRLSLTRGGRTALANDPLRGLGRAADALPPALARQTADGLKAALAALQAANGHEPFGVCRTCRHFRADAPAGAPHFCALLDERLSEQDSMRICAEHQPLVA